MRMCTDLYSTTIHRSFLLCSPKEILLCYTHIALDGIFCMHGADGGQLMYALQAAGIKLVTEL